MSSPSSMRRSTLDVDYTCTSPVASSHRSPFRLLVELELVRQTGRNFMMVALRWLAGGLLCADCNYYHASTQWNTRFHSSIIMSTFNSCRRVSRDLSCDDRHSIYTRCHSQYSVLLWLIIYNSEDGFNLFALPNKPTYFELKMFCHHITSRTYISSPDDRDGTTRFQFWQPHVKCTCNAAYKHILYR